MLQTVFHGFGVFDAGQVTKSLQELVKVDTAIVFHLETPKFTDISARTEGRTTHNHVLWKTLCQSQWV
jgi:dihydroorotase-like cyclic amidohydrolase